MRTFRTFALCVAFVFAAGICMAKNVHIFVVNDMLKEPALQHGVNMLARAVEGRGYNIIYNKMPPADALVTTIIIGDVSVDEQLRNGFINTGMSIPEKPESFLIRTVPPYVFAGGVDEVGAMYAAYEMAEQFEMSADPDNFAAGLSPGVHVPSMEIRAVNPFFHVEAFNDPASWYYDDEYWITYLNELSMDRYNLLDIHAMYELISTFFPNCYLYLMNSEKFPDIGISKEQADKNLAMFNKIAALARNRGIRVSLMSYHASWKLTSADPLEEPSDADLAAYTSEMVTKMIDASPDLWMLGFRIGESSRPEKFFQDSYIKGVEDANRDINLFTRSWVANPFFVRGIADAYPGKFYIEIKYNGEQLGLPYNAMTHNRRDTAPSYTWEDYTNWPRHYKIIWQIRSNGTHRLFRWGDPVFAGRAMHSVQFGDAAGFTMEPMTSYYPMTDYFHKNHADFDYFTWDHQRNWFWYMLWGRLSYDPDTSEAVWLHRFEKKFGTGAAPLVYETVSRMSRIVPLIYSYRCLGPDHRNMAPEYETGGTLFEFTNNVPLDFFNLRAIDEYARWRRFDADMLYAKLGPFEAADLLDKYADQANIAASQARAVLDPAANAEFKDILVELECLTHLARYYSNKIRAATYFRFFLDNGAFDDLAAARSYINLAHGEWDQLSAVGEMYYGQILDTLRIRRFVNKPTFTWRELQASLKDDIKQLDDAEAGELSAAKDLIILHRPVWRAEGGKPVAIRITLLGGDAAPTLAYRKTGAEDWKKIDMKPADDKYVFAAEIPAADASGEIEYYIYASRGENKARYPSGRARVQAKQFELEDYMYNDAKTISNDIRRIEKKEKQKYVTISFKAESGAPVITLEKVDVLNAGTSARIRVRVSDASDIKSVELYHKPLPTNYLWEKTEMQSIGGGVFDLELKLTPEGLMYYVNASDINHNAAAWPNFLEETPYRWINSWDAAKNPYQ